MRYVTVSLAGVCLAAALAQAQAQIQAQAKAQAKIQAKAATREAQRRRPSVKPVAAAAPDEKTRWTELGAAWPHKDGKGFQLKFNACPIGDCEVVLREPLPKKAA